VAHIQKRNGRWQARYRGPDGKERTRRFDRKVDAESWLDTNGADISRGQWVDPKGGKTTFAEWADTWKATTAGLRPSTRARDIGYIDRYLLPTFGPVALSSIDYAMVATWLATMTSTGPKSWWDEKEQPSRNRRPVAPATAVKASQILGKIMGTAVTAKKTHSNPVDEVSLPTIEREEMRFLTPVEVDRLAGAIESRYRALILVSAYGGLRIGEMAGLRRGRIDVLRARVDVVETCVEVGGLLHFGQPKTKAGRRSVTLPRSVASVLDDHLATFTDANPDALVFSAPEGGPLRLATWCRRFWAPAVDSAGLAPLRPHDLRHTAVALWIATGANPLEVSRRAGHTSTSFTQDRYGHLFPEADGAVADRLEALISTVPQASGGDVVRMDGQCA